MSVVPIPVSLIGSYGCPGQLKGGHIDLHMPTVNCEIVGDRFPPPLQVDCSRLNLDAPYGESWLGVVFGRGWSWKGRMVRRLLLCLGLFGETVSASVWNCSIVGVFNQQKGISIKTLSTESE